MLSTPEPLSAVELRRVHRSFVWRAVGVLILRMVLIVPAAISFVIGAVIAQSDLLPVLPIIGLLFVLAGALFAAVSLINLIYDAVAIATRLPLLFVGEIIRTPQGGHWSEKFAWGTVATISLDVASVHTVTRARGLIDVTSEWGTVQELRVWGLLRRRLRAGDLVGLVCSPSSPAAAVNPAATVLTEGGPQRGRRERR